MPLIAQPSGNRLTITPVGAGRGILVLAQTETVAFRVKMALANEIRMEKREHN